MRRLFRVALASLLVSVSNVRIDGKGRRYRQNWRARSVDPDAVLQQFLDGVRRMIEDIHRYSSINRPLTEVMRGDARTVLASFHERVDAVIFSPPYPNSFDYTDIYNIELWTLGYLIRAEDNTSLRKSTLRSHVQISWTEPQSLAHGTLRKTLDELKARSAVMWDRRLPMMVHAYFDDLREMLQQIRRCLAPQRACRNRCRRLRVCGRSS